MKAKKERIVRHMGNAKEQETARPLTEAEKIRVNKINQLTQEMESKGYVKKDFTIGLIFANIMAFIIGIPICAVFGILFLMHHSKMHMTFGIMDNFLLVVLIILSIVVHEWIHGMFWAIFAKNHFKSIEFGFIKEYATPYCTCLEPLSKVQYIIGAIMPGIILGILPMTIAIFSGSLLTFVIGVVMTIGAGGDFMIILKLLFYRSKSKDVVFVDHPTACGLILYERN